MVKTENSYIKYFLSKEPFQRPSKAWFADKLKRALAIAKMKQGR